MDEFVDQLVTNLEDSVDSMPWQCEPSIEKLKNVKGEIRDQIDSRVDDLVAASIGEIDVVEQFFKAIVRSCNLLRDAIACDNNMDCLNTVVLQIRERQDRGVSNIESSLANLLRDLQIKIEEAASDIAKLQLDGMVEAIRRGRNVKGCIDRFS